VRQSPNRCAPDLRSIPPGRSHTRRGRRPPEPGPASPSRDQFTSPQRRAHCCRLAAAGNEGDPSRRSYVDARIKRLEGNPDGSPLNLAALARQPRRQAVLQFARCPSSGTPTSSWLR
jgi:hypothetical protein